MTATPAALPILSTENLSKQFGGFSANKDISVSFPRGQLSAVIGPNGAGKSTFFNMLSGTFAPSSGRLLYEGRDITGLPQHQFAKIGIAKSFQITNVFPSLSVRENVRTAVQAVHSNFNLWSARSGLRQYLEKADALLELVGLYGKRLLQADQLAHGEQRCLEIALALACDPKLLLMDEPTAGMSPEETADVMKLILRLVAERTVVLVEHKMKLVMGACDRIIVLHHGELLAEGSPDQIRTNAEVRRVYLGKGNH